MKARGRLQSFNRQGSIFKMTEARRPRNVDPRRGADRAAEWITPERDCTAHGSRSAMQAARLRNASRISGKSVSSAHRLNVSACSRNSLADEFKAMTHLAYAATA